MSAATRNLQTSVLSRDNMFFTWKLHRNPEILTTENQPGGTLVQTDTEVQAEVFIVVCPRSCNMFFQASLNGGGAAFCPAVKPSKSWRLKCRLTASIWAATFQPCGDRRSRSLHKQPNKVALAYQSTIWDPWSAWLSAELQELRQLSLRESQVEPMVNFRFIECVRGKLSVEFT